MILYGAPVREKIKEDLTWRIKKFGRKLVLAIVQVGDREDSNIYIRQKQKFGEEIGVEVKHLKIDPAFAKASAGEEEIIEKIKKLNEDENVDGIIVQLPLPKDFNQEKILNAVEAGKDADGLAGGSGVIPATARGVMTLLDFYNIEIKNKKVCVIGQGILAGKPIADELEKRGAQVARCDINTTNIPEMARGCDILVSAVGKAGLVTKEFVNGRQVVVDVGINKITPPNPPLTLRGGQEEEKNDSIEIAVPPPLNKGRGPGGGVLVGDVVFEEVEPLVSAITPVPGGVGPLTVACLFQNLVSLVL